VIARERRRIVQRLTKEGLAGIAVIPGILAGAATAAADPQALSSFVPITIEDAYPAGTGILELQGVTYWDHGPKGRDLVNLAPEIKLGAFPRTQLEIESPYALGNALGHDTGSVTFGGLYQLNEQGDVLPAFAVHEDYSRGFGLRGGSSGNSLRFIATKSLGSTDAAAPRLHLNLTWLRAIDADANERTDRYQAAIGYSQLVSADTALVVDYVHTQNSARNSASNLVEAGLRHAISDDFAVSAGAGAGFGQQSPDFRVLLAIQYDFKAF
jgi:hypothetical protein